MRLHRQFSDGFKIYHPFKSESDPRGEVCTISYISRVFRIVILRLENLLLRETQSGNEGDNAVISIDDYKEYNYLLRTIYNILCSLSPNGWMSLLTQTLNPVDKQKDGVSEGKLREPNVDCLAYR